MCTAIVILNYNGADDTIKCIESIEKFNTAKIKYIVVDNCSTKNDSNLLNCYFRKKYANNYSQFGFDDYNKVTYLPHLSLVSVNVNGGYAKGNNIGLQFAYADNDIDNVLILNNDVLFVEDIIPGLITDFKSIDDCAIISPILYTKDLKSIDYNCARKEMPINYYISYRLFRIFYKIGLLKEFNQYILKGEDVITQKYVPMDMPSGSCMLFDKSFFREIDSFDPNTFLYYEENILFRKIKKYNKKNYLSTNYKCIHLGASSTKKESNMFIIKTLFESEKYYIKNYSGANFFQYALYWLANRYNLLLCYLKVYANKILKKHK